MVQYPLSSPFSLFVAIDQDPVIACIEVETRFGDHLLQQKHAVPLGGANAFAGETGRAVSGLSAAPPSEDARPTALLPGACGGPLP